MDKRIELEMRGKPPSEITQLNLDNCRSTQVIGLSSEFTNLEFLSLINVGLTSLKGFPKLEHLKKLELSDNRLSTGFENLSGCTNLKTLNLSGNKIKDVKALEPLKDLEHLKSLDLFNCDLTQEETYRTKVFEILPKLKFLDGFDKEDKEAEETDEEGLSDDDEDEEDDDEDVEDLDDEEGSDDDDEEGSEDDDDDDDEEGGEEANGDHKKDDAVRGKKRKHEDADDDDE